MQVVQRAVSVIRMELARFIFKDLELEIAQPMRFLASRHHYYSRNTTAVVVRQGISFDHFFERGTKVAAARPQSNRQAHDVVSLAWPTGELA